MNIEKLRKLKKAVADENWSMVEIHVDDLVCEAESNPHEPIVIGAMIATAGNAINSLSSLISGIANGKRKDLLKFDLQNAKDQIELLTDNMQKYQ